jgi:hypothetical protein
VQAFLLIFFTLEEPGREVNVFLFITQDYVANTAIQRLKNYRPPGQTHKNRCA